MFDDWFDAIETGPGGIDRHLFAEAILQQRFDLLGNGHWHLRGGLFFTDGNGGAKGKMANAIGQRVEDSGGCATKT